MTRMWLLVTWIAVALASPAVITVDWDNITAVSNTYATLQVVVNPLYERGSPIYNGTFEALSNLGAEYVRFQGWHPYPRVVVAELEPPSGNPVCASAAEHTLLYLSCYEGVFQSIDYASFGTIGGRCENWTTTNCHSNVSVDVVQKYCLGKQSCSVNASITVFGDPCPNVVKRLAVQASCSVSVNNTFWNFTLLNPIMEDFMEAQQNRSVMVNFCTSPEWLWNTPTQIVIPEDPNEIFWGYNVGTDLRDQSYQDIVNYNKRVYQYYSSGGFYDEYDVFHPSNYHYNFSMWEVYNEMDLTGHTVQSYTAIYDAIAMEIKQLQPDIQLVGLSLGSAMNNYGWAEYFLNTSHHLPGAPLEWISYHFYAAPSSRTDNSSYMQFFSQADSFLSVVEKIQGYRSLLAPWVKTDINELGVILPDDIDPNAAAIPKIYWNAAGAMFAYIYAKLIPLGIEVLGESQLVGYPVQYPSVSMMDWTTGKPNSRYWVLYLLSRNFEVGDKTVLTSSSSSSVFAQGFLTAKGKAILIVNKINQSVNVTVTGLSTGEMSYVDLSTFESPPATVSLSGPSFSVSAFGVAVINL